MSPDDLHGRIIDVDSHLALFPETLEEILGKGPGGGEWRAWTGGPSVLDEVKKMMVDEGHEPFDGGEKLLALQERARTDVWGVKEFAALGAHIALDRVNAIDQMGIERQLAFAQFMDPITNADGPEAAAVVSRYNDYVLDWAEETKGRTVPVCLLNPTDRDAALAEVQRVLGKDARAVELPGTLPPGGLSPAAPEWDPLWAALAEAEVPALIHAGGTGEKPGFLNPAWNHAARALTPAPEDPSFGDFHTRPFFWMNGHLSAEVLLTFLVLGGVFERHPDLRFGVIELGASWVAPLCERMDTTAQNPSQYLGRSLSLRPSEYIRRQVRVTPFYFEPVGQWIERSGLEEVYAFSTDYPHREGGPNPIGRFYDSLAPLGDKILERFFVTNGTDLLAA